MVIDRWFVQSPSKCLPFETVSSGSLSDGFVKEKPFCETPSGIFRIEQWWVLNRCPPALISYVF